MQLYKDVLQQNLAEQDYKFKNEVVMLEKQIIDSNRSANELQEAYNEKHRKCQAWEKAYNSVRCQITGRVNSAEVSPIERRQQQQLLPRDLLKQQLRQQNQPQFAHNSTSLPLAHATQQLPSRDNSVVTVRNITKHHLSHTVESPPESRQQRGYPHPPFSVPGSSVLVPVSGTRGVPAAPRREYFGEPAFNRGSTGNRPMDRAEASVNYPAYAANAPQQSRYFHAHFPHQRGADTSSSSYQNEKRPFFDGV
mmetsp:Transcript_19915/g.40197  ORF Transcript_19915/g.40197 Transcript_19915/m.40197 type:complete len:251 (-) Transcript_19915:143-895(-)